MKRLALIVVMLIATSCGSSMDKHLATSEADGKPLVIEFYTSWCGACKRFARSVLPDPSVERALEDVTYVRYDAESASGSVHAKRYGVRGFPTFIIVNAAGHAVATIRGLPTTSRFVSFLEWGPVHALDEDGLRARLQTDSSPRTLLLAARFYASEGDLGTSVTYYDRALATLDDPTRLPDIAWERALIASAGGALRPLADAAAAYVKTHPSAGHVLDALGLAIIPGALDDAEANAVARGLIADVADDAAALNDITYTLLAADALDVALEAANAQLAIAPDDANAWDTLAEVHHYRRDMEAAVDAANEAIGRAESFSQRAIFEENKRRYGDEVHRGTIAVDTITTKTQTLLADLRIVGATTR
jgi:thiol-disulfide isomerase/thioredoxin